MLTTSSTAVRIVLTYQNSRRRAISQSPNGVKLKWVLATNERGEQAMPAPPFQWVLLLCCAQAIGLVARRNIHAIDTPISPISKRPAGEVGVGTTGTGGGVKVGVKVAVGGTVFVGVWVGVKVGVEVGVKVGVFVGVWVGVKVGVAVSVGVNVGVGVGSMSMEPEMELCAASGGVVSQVAVSNPTTCSMVSGVVSLLVRESFSNANSRKQNSGDPAGMTIGSLAVKTTSFGSAPPALSAVQVTGFPPTSQVVVMLSGTYPATAPSSMHVGNKLRHGLPAQSVESSHAMLVLFAQTLFLQSNPKKRELTLRLVPPLIDPVLMVIRTRSMDPIVLKSSTSWYEMETKPLHVFCACTVAGASATETMPASIAAELQIANVL